MKYFDIVCNIKLCLITYWPRMPCNECNVLKRSLSVTMLLLPYLFVTCCVEVVFSYHTFQAHIPNGDKVPNPCPGAGPGDIWRGVGHYHIGGGGRRNPFGLVNISLLNMLLLTSFRAYGWVKYNEYKLYFLFTNYKYGTFSIRLRNNLLNKRNTANNL